MKLVDADGVSAEIKKIMFPATNLAAVCYNVGIRDALSEIEDAKTIDAVPVVRCKDCKHAIMTHDGYTKYCEFFADAYDGYAALYLEPGSYCSYGEKKEDTDGN